MPVETFSRPMNASQAKAMRASYAKRSFSDQPTISVDAARERVRRVRAEVTSPVVVPLSARRRHNSPVISPLKGTPTRRGSRFLLALSYGGAAAFSIF